MAWRKTYRTPEELREEMTRTIGWLRTQELIDTEAHNLRLPPESGAAIRHAYAAHKAAQPTTAPEEELPL